MPVELARYIVDAVVLEGRSYGEVARAHGVSKSWVAKLVWRFKAGGYEAITPRARIAKTIPNRTSTAVQDQIIELRKRLLEAGFDGGAHTISHHLALITEHVPSVSTIHRVLVRRGFVTPEPHKRPRSSWHRFEADLPNECWQSDVTHWRLADDSEVEIINFIDDYSRLCLASTAVTLATAPLAVDVFKQAISRHGEPSSVLTDNGCVYTTWHRGGPNAMQTELMERGIAYKHSRPYHPQTCGKVERFHQTLKLFLGRQPAAHSLTQLQEQIDRFVAYYNEVRPHRSRGRITPRSAFDARDKARPTGHKIDVGAGVRVRRDRIDAEGKVTLRYRTKLHHIGVGKAHKRKVVIMLVHGLDVRVLTEDGELLRRLTLDPSRDYQPQETV